MKIEINMAAEELKDCRKCRFFESPHFTSLICIITKMGNKDCSHYNDSFKAIKNMRKNCPFKNKIRVNKIIKLKPVNYDSIGGYCKSCKKYEDCDSEYKEPAGSCDDYEITT